jgi:hypothetical protein
VSVNGNDNSTITGDRNITLRIDKARDITFGDLSSG